MDCAILCLQAALEALEDEAAMIGHIRTTRPDATDEDIRASIAISREHHEMALEILEVYNGIERSLLREVLSFVTAQVEGSEGISEADSEGEEIPSKAPLEEYPEVSGSAGESLGYPEGPRLIDSRGKTSWN